MIKRILVDYIPEILLCGLLTYVFLELIGAEAAAVIGTYKTHSKMITAPIIGFGAIPLKFSWDILNECNYQFLDWLEAVDVGNPYKECAIFFIALSAGYVVLCLSINIVEVPGFIHAAIFIFLTIYYLSNCVTQFKMGLAYKDLKRQYETKVQDTSSS